MISQLTAKYFQSLENTTIECAPVTLTCAVEKCSDTKIMARGWCTSHYRRWYRHGDPLAGRMFQPSGLSVAERFWSKVEFTDTCWLWTAGCVKGGYGEINIAGKIWRAHRWAYEFCVGPIPEGLTLDHLCRVRACVRPDHLEPVTLRVNGLRGVSPPAINARKTHCPQGHSYDEANTYRRSKTGWRSCRTCDRARQAA